MKARTLSYLFSTLVLLFAFTRSQAAVESTIASLCGDAQHQPILLNNHLSLADQWYPFPVGWASLFQVEDATANVVLRYDDKHRVFEDKTWTLDVTYTIVTRPPNSNTPSTTTGQTLHITYDPREGIHYTDRDMMKYSNADRAEITVTNVSYNEWTPAGSVTQTATNATSLPAWLSDVYLDLELHIERYYNLSTASAPTMTLSENTTTNELNVSWNYVQGAESYDLEWLFIDVGDATFPFTSSYDYDWSNATRVNVPDQHYSISLAFPKGILLVRVRGAGIDWDNYVNNNLITRGEGTWTSTSTTGTTGSYTGYRHDIQTGLLPGMNWAYSAGFAEDGKRMDGAQFYDGMMRGREAVTTVNTDNNVVVGSSAFDFEGRPAVAFLPYVEQNGGIKYYGGNADYDAQDFDVDTRVTAPAAMGATTGSGYYYSTSNTTATGINASTPDAGGYPYSRVTYMSDGTNRPATSTGVGDDLNAASGHQTQYFYGTPTQRQLDRLFGNEVGYASHYKKNFVVDPNGVISVSYIDQHGRVVATALAGATPDNLQSIDNPNGNPNSSVSMSDDLLGNNQVNAANDGTESEYTLTVTEQSLHTFTYVLGSVNYCGEVCYNTCKDCKYDLTISVYDTRTNLLVTPSTGSNPVTASNISSGTYTFDMTLNPGTYRVQKTLVLNQANLTQIRQDYIDNEEANHSCVDVITPTPVPCPGNCHDACTQHYLVDGVYVDDNGVPLENQADGPALIAACEKKLCDQPTTPDPCEVKRLAMLDDMSPGGQYFDNLPSHFSIDPVTGLQSILTGYYSVTTPSYSSGHINGWLDAQPNTSTMLAAINAVWTGTDFTNWDQVRANWDDSWAEVLLPYHPEYCAWNYHCGWSCIHSYTSPVPGVGTVTDTLTSASEFAYEQETQYETDGNYSGSDGYYWNPLDMTINGSTNVPTTALGNPTYVPNGANNLQHLDPRFAGSCDITICDSTSATAETTLENYLKNFYPAYDENDVFMGYYSLWYVALDPDGIASGTYNSDLSTSTLDFFTQLHGSGGLISNTPSAGQVTPYQFFRSVYFYYRELVIEQGFVGDADVATCQSQHIASGTSTPAYDADGYLAASTDNPVLTPEGFTIYYMHSPLIDIYGDGCSTPTMADIASVIDTLVNDGAANPNGIDNTPPQSGSCSCGMLNDFITSRGLGSASDADIAAALNNELQPTTAYTATDVTNWKTECAGETPSMTVLSADHFPEGLTCDLDFGIDDLDAAVQTNCEQENGDLAAYNANFLYQNQLNAAADAYIAEYKKKCVQQASETFGVDYDLHEYYYTLYYYDQAGNLVKTVPPEGVNIITNSTTLANVKTYRDDLRDHDYNTTTATFTPAIHDMRSAYAYNSLQQPILAQQNEQGDTYTAADFWESGERRFWYDYLGRMVVSQNSKQAAMSPPAYSYTVYDNLGRISEVGQLQSSTALTTDATGSRNSNDYYFYEFDHTASPTDLETWIAAAASTKREVTYTYYDEAMSGLSSDVTTALGTQENLRNRVASVVYDDDPTSTNDLYGFSVAGQVAYQSAFHYSYDIHGNVKAMAQETPALMTHNEDVKVTTYQYDLVSGNVNAVYYQQGQRDEFDHKYEYDKDNRMHVSYSSRDGQTWEKESKQFYYATGGMGRMEMGDKTVQGEDYVYTINGWLKGMNRNTIGNYGDHTDRDIGQDAEGSAGNTNRNFGADAAGFTLRYFAGDYTAVNSSTTFELNTSALTMSPQYNGNIAGMVTSMLDNTQVATEVQSRSFFYDQLYRIKVSLALRMDVNDPATISYTQDNRYREEFSYDWNGNITEAKRYSGVKVSGTAVLMDYLTYHYGSNSNLLTYIDDAGATACAYDDDLDDQSAGNYEYDEIGELKKDVSERINNTTPQSIEWNAYDKMKAVHKDQANNTDACTSAEYADADVEYLYTASQQRLCKIVKPHKAGGVGISDQDKWTYYWYAYDAGGQVMAVYKQTFEDLHSASTYKVHFDVQEQDVYGSGRLGIRKGDDDGKYYMQFTGAISTSGPTTGLFSSISYSGASSALSRSHYTREIGNKQYQIANHLGNVLVTVSDKRLMRDVYHYTLTGAGSDYTFDLAQNSYYYTPGTGTYTQSSGADAVADWYTADVLSYSDYYVFGAAETGRNGGDSYRYGFNGKENDNETHAGATQDYGMRMYDPRVGRFFSADPLMFNYPYYTPYQFAGNKPISYIDLDGGEEKKPGSAAAAGQILTPTNGGVSEKPVRPSGSRTVIIFNVFNLNTTTKAAKIVIPNSVTQSHQPLEASHAIPVKTVGSLTAGNYEAGIDANIQTLPGQQSSESATATFQMPSFFEYNLLAKKITYHFVYQALTPDIYTNTVDALYLFPQWRILSYNGGGKMGRLNRSRACYGVPSCRPGFSRDEFPYACTKQGGRGALVNCVPVGQQEIQRWQLIYVTSNLEVGDLIEVVPIDMNGNQVPIFQPQQEPQPSPHERPPIWIPLLWVPEQVPQQVPAVTVPIFGIPSILEQLINPYHKTSQSYD